MKVGGEKMELDSNVNDKHCGDKSVQRSLRCSCNACSRIHFETHQSTLKLLKHYYVLTSVGVHDLPVC